MKHIMQYIRQINQRRMTAFYLSSHGDIGGDPAQHQIEVFKPLADRPRSLREMFADLEYEADAEDDNP
ncbi:hypothetical protein [Candidimonas nitroreducens]|uniref:Uncharacterized protein n=1 Tax=Candidimonas nitroreducens TaxID=683354 RepID=A0A225M1K5_9BURK|nr:hypothetical protein [Candidimonas nitroreducens]OWT55224.1 hypothetical protein CEY11_21160 [Candidimonas nitroreducens]